MRNETELLPELAKIAGERDHIIPSESGKVTIELPPALDEIAGGRDHIITSEFGKATNHAPQTIRKNYCLTGECFGIRPAKVGNKLLWPVVSIAALLSGGAK
jgi:hypothetical protein